MSEELRVKNSDYLKFQWMLGVPSSRVMCFFFHILIFFLQKQHLYSVRQCHFPLFSSIFVTVNLALSRLT